MQICVPIREINRLNTLKKLQKVPKEAGLVEVWLDRLNLNDIKDIRKASKRPLIGVCRAKDEEGGFTGQEQERIKVLMAAAETGFEYIDCGLNTESTLIKTLKTACVKSKTKLIISKHFWKKTPSLEDLLKTANKAKNLGADIIKIAAQVNNWSDNTVLFELIRVLKEKKILAIATGMGEKGKISRIGCPLLGSFLTYVALDEKSKTAPGQLTLAEFNMYI